jgi:hypothetical protein
MINFLLTIRTGDVVEIDVGSGSCVQQAIINEWIKEANMNLHINKANTADYGRDLMADLIEYTNVVDGKRKTTSAIR